MKFLDYILIGTIIILVIVVIIFLIKHRDSNTCSNCPYSSNCNKKGQKKNKKTSSK